MIFADTSALYAYLSRDDQDHESVVAAIVACLDSDTVLTASSYVIAETMGLVQHRLGLAALGRFADDMLPLIHVQWMTATEHAEAWRLVQEVGKRSFTIVDASTAVLMRRDGAMRVLALDPEFRRLGFDVLPQAPRPVVPRGRRTTRR